MAEACILESTHLEGHQTAEPLEKPARPWAPAMLGAGLGDTKVPRTPSRSLPACLRLSSPGTTHVRRGAARELGSQAAPCLI